MACSCQRSPGAAICFESDEDASKYLNNTVLSDFEVRGNLTYQPDIDNMYSQVDILAELSAGLLEKCTFIPGGGQYLEYVGSVATVRDMVSVEFSTPFDILINSLSGCVSGCSGW